MVLFVTGSLNTYFLEGKCFPDTLVKSGTGGYKDGQDLLSALKEPLCYRTALPVSPGWRNRRALEL